MWTQTSAYDDAEGLLLEGEIAGELTHAPHSVDDRAYMLLLYREHAAQARQQEALRSMWTAVATVVIVALLAFGSVQPDAHAGWSAGILVCCASLLGAALNQKHYERYELHLSIMRGFRNMLAQRVREEIPKVTMTATLHHRRHFRVSRNLIGLQVLWRLVYLAAFVAGAALVWSSLARTPIATPFQLPALSADHMAPFETAPAPASGPAPAPARAR